MAKGRIPKPTALKILEGNPGKRRLPAGEPQPRRGVPEPPAELDAVALAEWHRLVSLLDEVGVLTHVDRGILAAYCVAWSDLLRARVILGVEGLTVVDDRGTVRLHPAARVQREAVQALRLCGAELGLSPASRSRVRVLEESGVTSGDPAEKYLS